MENFIKKYLIGVGLLLVVLYLATTINNISYINVSNQSAAVLDILPTDANPASGFAWNDNIGWINFGEGDEEVEGRVYVSNNELYGYAWGENVGWISMNCENDDSCGTSDYTVTQSSSNGILTGYAWGENIGWIDFAPEGGGVTLTTNTSGTNTFSGYAWGENVGWISFSCENDSSCETSDYGVTTTWTKPGGGGTHYYTCVYEYSPWSTCLNNEHSRTVLSQDYQTCTNSPELTESCTVPIGISISPATSTITFGQTVQFIATVTGTTSTAVTWAVIPVETIIDGFYGTTTENGLYIAPKTGQGVINVNIQAKSQADITKVAVANVVVRLPIATTQPCTDYTYTAWGACINNTQTRSILGSIPETCIDGVTATTTQSCSLTIIPTEICTGYTYSDWSPCLNNSQTRTTLSSIPDNCVGGADQINNQTCTNNSNPPAPTQPPHSGGGTVNVETEEILTLFSLGDISVLGTTTGKIILGAQKILENKTGSAVTKTITAVGVVAGSSAFILSGTVVADLLFLPFKLWALLLSALGLRKRKRPWGTVYDSVTKQPIDPAYVTLRKIDGTGETTSITDLDGRYGFMVAPGIYTLVANKTNYIFPSQKMFGKTEDTLYGNLYFGGEINIETADAVINKNIPLDPIKFDWNEFVKGEKKLMKFYSRKEKVVRILTDWVFRIGFVISLISLFFVPAPYNMVIFGLYILLVILRRFGLGQRALGSLTEKDGNPLSYAIIRVFSSDFNVEITNKVASKIGRYFCLVPKGKYYVKIEKKNDDESYSEVLTSPVFEAKNGIINKSFIV